MSAQPGDAPTARTLFRSPAKPAAGAAAVTPPAAARDLRAEALSTRQAVDLSSKSGLRRALGEILLDVERAGDAGLDAAGFGAARTVLDTVGKAAADNAYSPDQRDEVSRAFVVLLDALQLEVAALRIQYHWPKDARSVEWSDPVLFERSGER